MHDTCIVYLEITISFLILCEGETKTLEILTPVIILFLCLDNLFIQNLFLFRVYSQYPFSKTLKKGFDSSSVIFSSDL